MPPYRVCVQSAGSGPIAAAEDTACRVAWLRQDLEEWSHVERWAYPRDMPVFVIAPPGRSRSRAITVAAIARDQGRQVVGVIPEGDDEIARHARFVLPVHGRVREEFCPLRYHVFACYLASYTGYPARTAAAFH